MTVFDAEQQQRVVDATRSKRDLCLLKNPSIEQLWTGGGETHDGPLVEFMSSGSPIACFGPYELLGGSIGP